MCTNYNGNCEMCNGCEFLCPDIFLSVLEIIKLIISNLIYCYFPNLLD